MAALSLGSGECVADPFAPTAAIVEALRAYAKVAASPTARHPRPADQRSSPAHAPTMTRSGWCPPAAASAEASR